MWTRRKLKRENERLRAELRKAIDQRDDARQDAEDSLGQVKRLAVQYAEADGAARRVAGRNKVLKERLEEAREAQGDGEFEALYGRLCRALRGCARYRQELTEPTPAQGPGLLTQLRRSEEARRKLDAQLAVYERRQWPRKTPPTAAPVQPAATPSGLLPSLRKGAAS